MVGRDIVGIHKVQEHFNGRKVKFRIAPSVLTHSVLIVVFPLVSPLCFGSHDL
jgi:hypothetical protein